MLLPLCRIARAGRVREDVRFKALRFSLVGKNVRETAYSQAV
jgi:hypothetical protein